MFQTVNNILGLLRYFSTNRAIQFTENLELYFSPIEEFNDLHDTPMHLIQVKDSYSEKELRQILKSLLPPKIYKLEKKRYMDRSERKAFPSRIREIIEEIKKKMGV